MQNGKPRQTKFNIYCAEKQDEVNLLNRLEILIYYIFKRILFRNI